MLENKCIKIPTQHILKTVNFNESISYLCCKITFLKNLKIPTDKSYTSHTGGSQSQSEMEYMVAVLAHSFNNKCLCLIFEGSISKMQTCEELGRS